MYGGIPPLPGSTQLCDLFEFFEDNTDSNFVLLGDFNLPEIQWATDTPAVPPEGRAIAKRFCSFVLRNDLTQHVRFPTHVKGNLLDLIFSNFSPIPTFKDADVGLSDHTALSFVFPSFLPQIPAAIPRTARLLFDFNKARMSNMQVHIAELYKHLQVLATTCTTNLLWTVFKENVLKIAKTYIPEQKPRPSRFWLSRETKTICGKKRRLF